LIEQSREAAEPLISGRIASNEIAALASAGEPAPPPPHNGAPRVHDAAATLDRRYITGAMMVVMVLASMEQTVTSTAMPTIIGDLHGIEHYSWVASIYLLACTVSMPLYGRLADALGRKKVVLASIGIFCIASMMAAASHTMGQLILFRGLQGLGAGGIMPVVLTIIGDIFTIEERAKIQGFFSAVWGTASLAGPALGAFLVNTLGWRSIFFVNLPLGLIGMAVLAWKYHDREKPHSTDLDLPGVTLLGIACAALLLLVSRIGPDGWAWPSAVALGAIAVGMMAWFIFVERKAANPILPPSLMTHRAIGPSLIGSCLLGVGFLSLDTYVPLYVQGAKGGGAAAAASVVTPVMLAWATSGIVSAPLIVRWGFRKTALLGCLLTVISFIGLCICAVMNSPHWVMTAVLLISGFGFGPASMAYLLAAQDAVAWQQRGIITSSIQFFRTIGGAVGIGVMGMLFNILTAPEMRRLRADGINPASLLNPHSRSTLSEQTLHAASAMFGHGLTWVFAAMLICAAVQLGITMFMPNRKGKHAINASEAMEAMAG
jgi:EmrB/QacA subfamily drug resistance transporter